MKYLAFLTFAFATQQVFSQAPKEIVVSSSQVYHYTEDDRQQFRIMDGVYNPSDKKLYGCGFLEKEVYRDTEEGPAKFRVNLGPVVAGSSSRKLNAVSVQLLKGENNDQDDRVPYSRIYKAGKFMYTGSNITSGTIPGWMMSYSGEHITYNDFGQAKFIAGIFDLKGDYDVISYYDRKEGEVYFQGLSGGYINDYNDYSFYVGGDLKDESYYYTGKKFYDFIACPTSDAQGYHYSLQMTSDRVENMRLFLNKYHFTDLGFSKSPVVSSEFLNAKALTTRVVDQNIPDKEGNSWGKIKPTPVPSKSDEMIAIENFRASNGRLLMNKEGNLVWYFHSYKSGDEGINGAFMAEISTAGKLIDFKNVHDFGASGYDKGLKYVESTDIGYNQVATTYMCDPDCNGTSDDVYVFMYMNDMNTVGKGSSYKFKFSRSQLKSLIEGQEDKTILQSFGIKLSDPIVVMTSASRGVLLVSYADSYKVKNISRSDSQEYIRKGGVFAIPFTK